MRSSSVRLGQRFGRLVAIRQLGCAPGDKNARSAFICDCGQECVAHNMNVRNGHTRSCGCLKVEAAAVMGSVPDHGHCIKGRKSPEYSTWRAMIGRCTLSCNPSYKYYGARGITICALWKDSFEAFLKDMGPRPAGCSIERVNVDGNYEPSNCRWATAKEQAQNRHPRGAGVSV